MVEVEWTAHEIRALRAALRLSLPEFARIVDVKRRTLWLWETGQTRRPHAASRRQLDKVLAAAVVSQFEQARSVAEQRHSAVVVTPGETEDENDMRRRQFLSAIAGAIVGLPEALDSWLPALPDALAPLPTRVGPADVVQLKSITDDLRRISNAHGGCASVDAAHGALSWSANLLDRAVSDAIRRELLLALADLANVTGWACHDAGAQAQARRFFAQALTYSRSVDSVEADSVTASIMYGLGRVSLHQQQPKEALRFVQLGQIAAQDGHDLGGSARLHATAAWAYALLGRQQQVDDSLDRAEHEMSRVDTATLEPWHRVFFARGDFIGHRALVFGVLADMVPHVPNSRAFAERAAQLATTSLAESGPDRAPRSLLFDRIVLASAQLHAHEVDAGTATALLALSEARTIRSVRAVERLAEVAEAAKPFTDRHSGADQIVNEIQCLVPAGRD